jgi:membrane-associated phospholipid phosphatase
MRGTLEVHNPRPAVLHRGGFDRSAVSATEMPIQHRSSIGRSWASWAFVLVSLLALPWVLFRDAIISRWCRTLNLPSELDKFLNLTEAFGHGSGVTVIGLAVGLAIPQARRGAFSVVALALLAGLVADGGKLVVARARPKTLKAEGGVRAKTFREWWPLGKNHSRSQSFPSAHTATAVAFAFGMGRLLPGARWLFVALAASVAMQRVVSGSHYVGDVLVGACLGCLLAMAWFRLWEATRAAEPRPDPSPRLAWPGTAQTPDPRPPRFRRPAGSTRGRSPA